MIHCVGISTVHFLVHFDVHRPLTLSDTPGVEPSSVVVTYFHGVCIFLLKSKEMDSYLILPIYNKLCVCACSVMTNSLQPYGLYPCRHLCSWDSSGKNTGIGCHALLQGVFPTQVSSFLHWQMDSLQLAPPGKPHTLHWWVLTKSLLSE